MLRQNSTGGPSVAESEVLWGSGKHGFYPRYREEGAVDTFRPAQVLFQFWGCSGGRRCIGSFLSLLSWLRVERVGSRGCFWLHPQALWCSGQTCCWQTVNCFVLDASSFVACDPFFSILYVPPTLPSQTFWAL